MFFSIFISIVIVLMNAVRHPSEYVSPEYVQQIRDTAGESELLKRLHPLQLTTIYEQKWFQLFVPALYYGLGLSLPEALRLEEALAWTDGSLGWTVTLCAGAGWFIGFLEPETISSVFNNHNLCIAGSGKSSGIARIVENGYEVTGYWDYATGASHATAFTANCVMELNGDILKNEDGNPLVQSFLFLRDEVRIQENWSSMGMIATGSHSFEVNGVRVKSNRCFRIDGQYTSLPDSIYQYPFLPFAETTLAVNSSGMAIRFLDLCELLFKKREPDAKLQPLLENSQNLIEQTRKLFYETVENSWSACLNNRSIPLLLLNNISLVSKRLALVSRHVVDELYPCCGLQAADPRTEINRVWRNLHTASQHSLLHSCNGI